MPAKSVSRFSSVTKQFLKCRDSCELPHIWFCHVVAHRATMPKQNTGRMQGEHFEDDLPRWLQLTLRMMFVMSYMVYSFSNASEFKRAE